MARAAKRKREAELLGGAPPQPYRKLKTSVVPIADAVARETVGSSALPRVGNVVSITRVPNKTRFDFKSDLDYQLYLEFRKIQEKERADKVEMLQDLRGTIEVPNRDLLPQPAAAASSVTKDESKELAAYLAHHNPMGATKHIPTVEGYVYLKDGTELKVHKRQDLLEYDDDGKVQAYLPYGGFNADGMCFKLTGDLKRDRRTGERITSRSQNSRERLGKANKTAYLNLVVVNEYRPVPDVDWFLRNPDGKSYLRGDLNPYPPGKLPEGDDLASYLEDKKEHERKAVDFFNTNLHSGQRAANMLSAARSPSEIKDWVRIDMMMHDGRDLAIMQEREKAKRDDLPWSYDEVEAEVPAANDIDYGSQVQGSDATETTPRPGHANPAPLDSVVLAGIQAKTKQQYYKSFRMRKEREAIEPAPVVPDVSTTQHQKAEPNDGENVTRLLSLDLRDKRAVAALHVLEKRIRMDMLEMQEHLENVVKARWLAECYQKTGTFQIENTSEALDALGVDVVIERIPYTPVYTRDLRKGAGFRKMAMRADALRNAEAGRLRAWARADELRQTMERARQNNEILLRKQRLTAEIKALKRIKMRALAFKYTSRPMSTQQRLREEHHRINLDQYLYRLKESIPAETSFLRALGMHNHMFRGRIQRQWKRKVWLRKQVGRVKWVMNLGPRKQGKDVQPPPPSMEREPPINTPVVTLLPQPTPPEPKPQVKEESRIILPRVEVSVLDTDPVLQSVRRAHIMRIRQSGKFTADELKLHDKLVFGKLVA